jgi:hypothetical protein
LTEPIHLKEFERKLPSFSEDEWGNHLKALGNPASSQKGFRRLSKTGDALCSITFIFPDIFIGSVKMKNPQEKAASQ